MKIDLNYLTEDERSYVERASEHTGKNDMKAFLKAVRIKFAGLDIIDIRPNMTVLDSRNQHWIYSKGTDSWYGPNFTGVK
jgi:hypothetical protein